MEPKGCLKMPTTAGDSRYVYDQLQRSWASVFLSVYIGSGIALDSSEFREDP